LVRKKKLRKVKMKLSPESGNDRSPSPESGEHVWPDLAKIAGFRQDTSGPGQIWPDPVILAGSRQDQWPESGLIWLDSGRISVQIRSNQAGFRPVSVHGRIPARFRRHSAQLPDVAGFRRPAEFRQPFRQPAVFRWSDSDADIILVT
jgi:hypothetical protein